MTAGGSASAGPPRPWEASRALWFGYVILATAATFLVLILRGSGSPVAAGSGSADPGVECTTPAQGCPVVRAVSLPVRLVPLSPSASSPSPSPSGGPVPVPVEPAPPPFELRALQMNLCDSGTAHNCYTGGRAVTEAARKIAAFAPDVVTLNEVCQHDVLGPLLSAMAAVRPPAAVVAAFEPEWNRSRGTPYRCTDGDNYGDGVIARLSAADYSRSFVAGGTYPETMQDQADDEERGWICVDMGGRYDACTSHLVASHPALATRQCDELMGAYVPGFVGRHGTAVPVIIGSDFNLVDNGDAAYDVNACAPAGFYVENDPARPGVEPEHFMVSRAFALRGLVDLDMEHTTDHPGLLITLRAGGSPAPAAAGASPGQSAGGRGP